MNAEAPKVLVTGGTGFLGHSLVPQLVRAGYSVRALVRASSDVSSLQKLGVDLAYGDVRDQSSIEAAITDCRYVVHGAGYFRFWGSESRFNATNVEGTRNVLDAAVGYEIEKFVHISTLVVIGKPKPDHIINEAHPLYPQDAYQKSKVLGEELARKHYETLNLPVVIIRPGAFYGPWGRYAFNRLFFEDPLRGLLIKINRGRYITFPAFIEDVAQGTVSALKRARPGETYNLSGESLSHHAANEIISRLAGLSSYRFNVPKELMLGLGWILTQGANILTHREPYYPLNLANYVFADWRVDSSKARDELGFETVSFEEGTKRTLAWYRKIGVWRGKVQDWEGEVR